MGRRLGLDVLKGACIVLVIFNHAVLWPMRAGDLPSAFAYGIAFGTVAAFSASAGYVQGLHPPREEWAVVRKRAGQLLVPWLIWAPLYAAAPFVWREAGGPALPIGFEPGPWAREILLGGGPLWFLPVLFVSTAVCAVLDRRTSGWWPAWVGFGAYLLTAVVSTLRGASPLELGLGTFWAVAPLYAASFWFGLRIARDGSPGIGHRALIAIVIASMLSGGVVTFLRAVHADARWLMWVPYGIGAIGGVAALVLAVSGMRPRDALVMRVGEPLARVGRASLGLYIAHPLLIAPLALFARGRGGVAVAVAIAAVVVIAGTPLVEWARGVPGLRRAL